MSTPSTIDRQAPVVAHHEMDIRASLDTVWRLHTDVNAWTGWQTDISEAHIEGPMEPGRSFDWSSFNAAPRSRPTRRPCSNFSTCR